MDLGKLVQAVPVATMRALTPLLVQESPAWRYIRGASERQIEDLLKGFLECNDMLKIMADLLGMIVARLTFDGLATRLAELIGVAPGEIYATSAQVVLGVADKLNMFTPQPDHEAGGGAWAELFERTPGETVH
ncbi:MAG: hypothetical protein ACHQQS_06630 [Thermoanaerobaculales bacterium]